MHCRQPNDESTQATLSVLLHSKMQQEWARHLKIDEHGVHYMGVCVLDATWNVTRYNEPLYTMVVVDFLTRLGLPVLHMLTSECHMPPASSADAAPTSHTDFSHGNPHIAAASASTQAIYNMFFEFERMHGCSWKFLVGK